MWRALRYRSRSSFDRAVAAKRMPARMAFKDPRGVWTVHLDDAADWAWKELEEARGAFFRAWRRAALGATK